MGKKVQVVNVMVGVAGSGKSTVVEKILAENPSCSTMVVCPDLIREEFCDGNRSDQTKNHLVWPEAYRRVREHLARGYDVIFDATMLNPKKRKDLVEIAKEFDAYLFAHVVEKPLDVILAQNANRQWKVPEHIVRNMFDSFVAPTEAEGFARVKFYRETA